MIKGFTPLLQECLGRIQVLPTDAQNRWGELLSYFLEHPIALAQAESDSRMPTMGEILSLITPESVHGEVDWGPPVGNEVW